MVFENVRGQERAASMLQAMLRSGMMPHALLFVGPRGVGKLALARELASVLLCTVNETDRCGQCASCRQYASGNHPDYFEIGVPEDKQELPIAAIRAIQQDAAVRPVIASRRVFVVRDADRMNIEAANCFLKTLEEPPGDCRIVLIACSLLDIPQTVVSRCRLIKFCGLPPAHVQADLQAEGVAEEEAWWLARCSWGSPGIARALNDMALPAFNTKLVEAACNLRPEQNFDTADMVLAAAAASSSSRVEGRLALQNLLECLAVLYRDAAAIALGCDESLLFNRRMSRQIRELASHMPLDKIIDSADRVFEAIEHIGSNANQRLTMDDLFTQLSGAADGK
jgi:DNA polymerase-3 subunit delta'